MLLTLAAIVPACAEWPRFSNLPPDTGEAVAPGDEVQVITDFAWEEREPVSEPDDDRPALAELEPVSLGSGILRRGKANGSGWDFDARADRPECDGIASGFPSEATGDYLGDIDWRRIEIAGAGVLCSSFAYKAEDARPDVLLYSLDACGNPGEPVAAAPGHPLGFAGSTNRSDWATDIDSPVTMGVVASAWAPDAPTRELTYNWGLALVADAADCPLVTGQ